MVNIAGNQFYGTRSDNQRTNSQHTNNGHGDPDPLPDYTPDPGTKEIDPGNDVKRGKRAGMIIDGTDNTVHDRGKQSKIYVDGDDNEVKTSQDTLLSTLQVWGENNRILLKNGEKNRVTSVSDADATPEDANRTRIENSDGITIVNGFQSLDGEEETTEPRNGVAKADITVCNSKGGSVVNYGDDTAVTMREATKSHVSVEEGADGNRVTMSADQSTFKLSKKSQGNDVNITGSNVHLLLDGAQDMAVEVKGREGGKNVELVLTNKTLTIRDKESSEILDTVTLDEDDEPSFSGTDFDITIKKKN